MMKSLTKRRENQENQTFCLTTYSIVFSTVVFELYSLCTRLSSILYSKNVLCWIFMNYRNILKDYKLYCDQRLGISIVYCWLFFFSQKYVFYVYFIPTDDGTRVKYFLSFRPSVKLKTQPNRLWSPPGRLKIKPLTTGPNPSKSHKNATSLFNNDIVSRWLYGVVELR